MEQAAGKVLLVCCCSVIADNFMALIQEETWMKKGWDLVRDVSTPAFSPGSFTRYSSCSVDFVRSFVQPHSVRWRGSRIFLLCRFFFPVCEKILFNLNLSFFNFFYIFYWLFDLSCVLGFHCVLVGQPESVMSFVSCAVPANRICWMQRCVRIWYKELHAWWNRCTEVERFALIIIKISAVTKGAARTRSKSLNVKGSKWA